MFNVTSNLFFILGEIAVCNPSPNGFDRDPGWHLLAGASSLFTAGGNAGRLGDRDSKSFTVTYTPGLSVNCLNVRTDVNPC